VVGFPVVYQEGRYDEAISLAKQSAIDTASAMCRTVGSR
jgi:hypothetical protein